MAKSQRKKTGHKEGQIALRCMLCRFCLKLFARAFANGTPNESRRIKVHNQAKSVTNAIPSKKVTISDGESSDRSRLWIIFQ
jgi:hypothetical protein